jgi:hypothetical protein
MASLIYNSFFDDLEKGNIDMDSDTFYGMLVTSSYTANKDTHTKRSDVTNEVTGTGYSSGGAASACTLTKDTVNDREDAAFADIAWTTSTITARGLVIYKRRGGASSADELVAYVDFGADISSVASTFTAHFTAPLRIQN